MQEIKNLNPEKFIKEKVEEISDIVGDDIAISALSGGVDSTVVTMLGHIALGNKLETYVINNGLMRKDELDMTASSFCMPVLRTTSKNINIIFIDAQNDFFTALKGIINPEEKREAIAQTFYKNVFRCLTLASGAKYLLQGTILTDIDEAVAGIKRHHNVFEQIGIDTEKEFGYKIIEPLIQLRKLEVREIAKALGFPKRIFNRIPFPGPGLAVRIIGEVTKEKVKLIRIATEIVEDELVKTDAFQYMAILHNDKVTGIRNGKRKFGYQIEIRCWDSVDATMAFPTAISSMKLAHLACCITKKIPEVVSVTYNITPKPPSTIEAE